MKYSSISAYFVCHIATYNWNLEAGGGDSGAGSADSKADVDDENDDNDDDDDIADFISYLYDIIHWPRAPCSGAHTAHNEAQGQSPERTFKFALSNFEASFFCFFYCELNETIAVRFIEMCIQYECLWNVNNSSYMNR